VPNSSRRAKRGNGAAKVNFWITLRKLSQYISLLLVISLITATRNTNWQKGLANLPINLDPLLMVANFLSTREFQISALLAIVTIVITFIVGRVWCGWVCPLGTTLDFFKFLHPSKKRASEIHIPQKWRSLKYLILTGVLLSALFGNLTLLILDPLTIFYRSTSAAIWPALDWFFTSAEKGLYNIPLLNSPINFLEIWLRPAVFPSSPLYYQQALTIFLLLVGIIALEYLAPRFWCRYLCPLGAMLGLISKTALVRRQVGFECKGCVLCDNSCPTGTIDPARSYASDPSECTMCLDCLSACPRDSINFPMGKPELLSRDYDPARREFLATLGITAISIGVLRSQGSNQIKQPHLLLPPGSKPDNFLTMCVRCSECIQACPTGGLQPSFLDSGIEGFWTPQLIPRIGYCEYSCNKCGQICPVQAIPLLDLTEKQETIIGKAYIDQNRCIAWADHNDCIVCEEMCPLPEKAVYLEASKVTGFDGVEKEILLPYVDRDLCIGCGICEYKCPVTSEAAIRVYSLVDEDLPV